MLDLNEVMKMEDKYEVTKLICLSEELSIPEMEEAMQRYADLHGIDTMEMAFYPNGDRVIDF